jgi:GT2 family glycosyltransferase
MKPIIIISRNNLPLTKLAVKSALTNPDTTTVVVDNASEDGTPQWIRSKDDFVSICLPKRRSLAACWNTGLASVWTAGCTEALVLNNDVQIREDTYMTLNSMSQDFVSCVSVNNWYQAGTAYDRSWTELLASRRPHPDFSAFMIRPKVTDTVGWFNEDYYPAYVEDCEYHVRMHRAGIQACCVDLPFYHAAAQTLAHANDKERRIIQRGADANRERFKQTYGCLPGTPEYQELFA